MTLAIYGAGDFGCQAMTIFKLSHPSSEIVFYDDVIKERVKNGVPVKPGLNQLLKDIEAGSIDSCFIALGYKYLKQKKRVFEILEPKISFQTIIHPKACIDETAEIQEGAIVYIGATIDMHAVIGRGAVVNCSATVSHHSHVGEFSWVGPNATLAGFCRLEGQNYMSTGSILGANVHVAQNWIIAANSTVLSSHPLVPDGNVILAGSPAQIKARRQLPADN